MLKIPFRKPMARSIQDLRIPDPREIIQGRRNRVADYRKRRLRQLLRRSRRIAMWAVLGGLFAYGLCHILTDDSELLLRFGAAGFAAAVFIKVGRCGRFAGVIFYGAPLTAAWYSCFHYEFFDPERVSLSMVYCISGAVMVAGALIGLSEELVRGDR